MRPRRNRLFLITAAAATLACALTTGAGVASAQSTSVFATGLKAPTRIVLTGKGNLLVAESGAGVNTGRLSLIDRKTGAHRTILDGLPSGANLEGGTSGPSGLVLRGDTLYMTIGQGDAVIAGPAPGTEKPNPNSSSRLFSSVLSVRASAGVETSDAPFRTLTAADHFDIRDLGEMVLTNADGETLTIRLIYDFPDHVPNARPDFPDNVRVSNPFGVAVSGGVLYVNDASHNLVKRIAVASGQADTLTTFAPIARPSPVTPPGGPFVEAVPDSVRIFNDRLYVTLLTGFPFQSGLSEIRELDIISGDGGTFVGNLTSAIDVLPVETGAADKFFVLEFSTNLLASQPGRLRIYEPEINDKVKSVAQAAGDEVANNSVPQLIASPLISPTGMARDPRNGDLFITSIFTGMVVRVDGARLFARQHYKDFLGREPDADGWNFWQNQITACGDNAGCRDRKQVDVSRAFYYSGEFIAAHPELAANLRGTVAYNRAFVKQAYLTYLQRTCDPETCDADGFNFWVGVLNRKLPNSDADYNEMIRAFIVSGEYRRRLGLS